MKAKADADTQANAKRRFTMDSDQAKRLMLYLKMAVPRTNIVKIVFHSEGGCTASYKIEPKKVKGVNKR